MDLEAAGRFQRQHRWITMPFERPRMLSGIEQIGPSDESIGLRRFPFDGGYCCGCRVLASHRLQAHSPVPDPPSYLPNRDRPSARQLRYISVHHLRYSTSPLRTSAPKTRRLRGIAMDAIGVVSVDGCLICCDSGRAQPAVV